MEHFDVEISIANLINEFSELKTADNLSILDWFYRAINYRSIFESRFKETIVTVLKEKGVTELTTPKEELESFKSLMKKDETSNVESIGNTLLSLILKSLIENHSITPYLEQLIIVYNETYNKEKTFSEMMRKLKSAIGEEIVFVLIRNRAVELITGKLESVNAYNNVVIDGIEYPFVGQNIEINKISTSSGLVLYSNITASPKDDLTDYKTLEKKKKTLFGNNYNGELKLL